VHRRGCVPPARRMIAGRGICAMFVRAERRSCSRRREATGGEQAQAKRRQHAGVLGHKAARQPADSRWRSLAVRRQRAAGGPDGLAAGGHAEVVVAQQALWLACVRERQHTASARAAGRGSRSTRLRDDDVAVRGGALVAHAVRDVARKQAPLVAAAVLQRHLGADVASQRHSAAAPDADAARHGMQRARTKPRLHKVLDLVCAPLPLPRVLARQVVAAGGAA
jgi:hypothetical protein